jgi:hypothetical protein
MYDIIVWNIIKKGAFKHGKKAENNDSGNHPWMDCRAFLGGG